MANDGNRLELTDRMMAPDGSPRWFSYDAEDGIPIDDDEEPLVEVLRFKADPYAGPFWASEEHLSDDFAELHRCLGISRQTYDDATAWNNRCTRGDAGAAELEFHRKRILDKLRSEVHSRIIVA